MKMQHVSIMTKCLSESVNFYCEQAGLHIRVDNRCSREHPLVFLSDEEGDTCVELVGSQSPAYYGGGISIGFRTDDIRREHAEKEAAGLHPGSMISPNPHTHFFFIRDPNGVEIQFIQEESDQQLHTISGKKDDEMKESINVNNAPAALGPYVHAVKTGELIFLSGQLGINPADGSLPESVEDQTRQSMENIKTVLEGCGSDLSHVVKTTIFLTDLADFGKVNEIYGSRFADAYPARSCVEVSALPKGALVEIEVVAVAG